LTLWQHLASTQGCQIVNLLEQVLPIQSYYVEGNSMYVCTSANGQTTTLNVDPCTQTPLHLPPKHIYMQFSKVILLATNTSQQKGNKTLLHLKRPKIQY